MNYKQLSLVLGIAVVILLGVVGYMSLKAGPKSDLINQQTTLPVNDVMTKGNDMDQTPDSMSDPSAAAVMEEPGPMPKMTYKITSTNCQENNQYSTIALYADGKLVTSAKSSLCVVDKVIFRNGNSKVVYYSVLPDGIGGYYIYNPVFNLYKLDLEKKSASEVSTMGKIQSLDFNKDLTKLVYVTRNAADDIGYFVVVKDLSSGAEIKYNNAPNTGNGESFPQIGGVKFSPDELKIAFAVGYGPENEHGEIYVLNLYTKNYSLYKKRTDGHLDVTGWKNNTEVTWVNK